MASLDHSWKGSHARWKKHDAWIAAKGALTMGYFTRADLPFYYALADAFTICDAYHCSIFGPTNPNRMFLFTGTSGLAVGDDGLQADRQSADESNETADQANDAKAFRRLRLDDLCRTAAGAAGIDWRVYQEYDNYGDNALAYFARFRNLDPASAFYRRGARKGGRLRARPTPSRLAAIPWWPRSPAMSRRQHCRRCRWIVAPYRRCANIPSRRRPIGEELVARLLAALTAQPEVWAKTVFILNYDENDGFFDHVPPPVPPAGNRTGQKHGRAGRARSTEASPSALVPRVPT